MIVALISPKALQALKVEGMRGNWIYMYVVIIQRTYFPGYLQLIFFAAFYHPNYGFSSPIL